MSQSVVVRLGSRTGKLVGRYPVSDDSVPATGDVIELNGRRWQVVEHSGGGDPDQRCIVVRAHPEGTAAQHGR